MNKKMWWSGCVLTGLVAALMILSGVMKLIKPPAVVHGMVQSGWSESLLVPLGVVELACTVVYLIPATSVLGAILLTGYMGGAVAASVRAGQPIFLPALVGIFVWGGIFLRDQRIRDLIPLKR